MATPALGYQNFFSTTLSSGISATDTVIPLTVVPTPSEGYLVIEVDSTTNHEIIYYTSKGGSSVTVPSVAAGRGVGGTSAASHSSGSTVSMVNVAELWTNLQNASAWATSVNGGWLPGSGTWTYASSTTFTVPSADAAAMSVGTKIWLSQSGSKYFYVTGVSGTTITVTGGSDYTVANAAITSPYFSNAATPFGFPTVFNYTPTFANLTVGNGTHASYFSMKGKVVNFYVKFTLGSTSSYGTNPTYTLPVTSASGSVGDLMGLVEFYDTSVPQPWFGHSIYATTTTAGVWRDGAGTNSTSPMTWATGDILTVSGSYKAA